MRLISQALSAYGRSLLNAANAAAARALLGLGSMATQAADNVAITGGNASLTNLDVTGTTASVNSVTGAVVVAGGVGIQGGVNVGGTSGLDGDLTVRGAFNYAPTDWTDAIDAQYSPNAIALVNNGFSGGSRLSFISGLFVDRLFGATARYDFTQTGFNTVGNAFNKSQNGFAIVAAGQTGTITVDLQSNGSSFLNLQWGVFFVTLHPSNRPTNLLVEVEQDGVWSTILNKANPNTYEIFLDGIAVTASVTKFRMTLVAGAVPAWVSSVEWFQRRPRDTELQQFIPLYSGANTELFSPALAIRGLNKSTSYSEIHDRHVKLAASTVAQLQAGLPGQSAGSTAYCTDESGGAVPVFYDGTNWRRMTDRTIIS
jgi:hypothetical protein